MMMMIPVFRHLGVTNRTCLIIKKSFKVCSKSKSSAFSVAFSEYGDPSKVLQIREFRIPQSVRKCEVLVKVLAAPINPADINIIQGVYAVKSTLPAVAGFEGVAEVVQVGEGVEDLQPGDWVIPSAFQGTWTTHAVWDRANVLKIPSDIPLLNACTLSVNPCSAYRMLKDFESLKPGDTVVQNGANSAAGQAVIQLAKEFGYVTVNIVRTRPEIDDLERFLRKLGADHVITEENARSKFEDLRRLVALPKLALNCVGGKSATELMRMLAPGATIVTYGGMSRQPITVSASSLIFNDIKVRGFWMTRWKMDAKHHDEWVSMIEFICGMIQRKVLLPPPCDDVPLAQYITAVQKAMKPFKQKKQIFVMEK